MNERIRASLEGSGPALDFEAQARARLPTGLADQIFSRPLVPAAVLVPLVRRISGLTVMFTRRNELLRDHPGQISFPGGRIDAADSGPLAAALRETSEELGVSPSVVEVAGYLPPQPVITGFAITPVVGFLPGDVPLAFFLDGDNARHSLRQWGGMHLPMVEYRYASHRIWGATAGIIFSLVQKI
ncbi:MAG: CoA pyrophosphatase [Gammaproteobacteria bacterium]|nr:CoA pyrophosphatase [Gammaproteobacteria bacterium]